MKASDALMQLAEKAKNVEDKVEKAKVAGRADLQSKVAAAKTSADRHAQEVRKKRDDASTDAERRWNDVHNSWSEHLARVHRHVEDKKADVDVKIAKGKADSAEQYAADAVEFASAALDEADYAVLDATLARMDADTLASAQR